MVVPQTKVDQRAEPDSIDRERVALGKPDRLPVDAEAVTFESPVQGRQGATERGAGVGLAGLGPQQQRQGVPPVASVGDREVGREGDGLPCIDPGRSPIPFDPGRSKEEYFEFGHSGTSRVRTFYTRFATECSS